MLPSCACQSAHAHLACSLGAAAAALLACTPFVPGAYAQVSRLGAALHLSQPELCGPQHSLSCVRQTTVMLATRCARVQAPAPVPVQVPLGQVAVHSYEEQTASRRRRASAPASTLPSAGEAEALLDLDRDLFTDDAWQGMQRRAA